MLVLDADGAAACTNIAAAAALTSTFHPMNVLAEVPEAAAMESEDPVLVDAGQTVAGVWPLT